MGMDNKLIDDEVYKMENCSINDLYDLRAQWRWLNNAANRIIRERDPSYTVNPTEDMKSSKIVTVLNTMFLPDDKGFIIKKELRNVIHKLNLDMNNGTSVEKDIYEKFLKNFSTKEYLYKSKSDGKRYRSLKGLRRI